MSDLPYFVQFNAPRVPEYEAAGYYWRTVMPAPTEMLVNLCISTVR